MIRPIERADEEEWRALFQSYCEFYKLDLCRKVADRTWERFFDPAVSMYASVAVSQDRLVGFVHWITHLSTLSTDDYIYLHDLYVDPTSRCHGVGRKLIETVFEAGDRIGAARVYWQTQVRSHLFTLKDIQQLTDSRCCARQMDNHRAQLLYTKVGVRNGFISYQRSR